MRHQLSAVTAALTATTRSAVTEITVPGGKGKVFTLQEIRIVNYPTVETVVNSGGIVEVENDSVDYKPLKLVTRIISCVTEGGGQIKPNIYKVNCPLPAGSKVQFYANPFDNQSQKYAYTIVYDDAKAFRGPQTYAESDLGTAITQVTIDTDHLTFTIPNGKAGDLQSLLVIAEGTLETVVDQGGLIDVNSKSIPTLSPMEQYIGGATCVDAGGADVEVEVVDLRGHKAPGGAVIDVDYTPQDNQSQNLAGSLVWTH